MPNPTNPYSIQGGVQVPTMFFGRHKETQTIFEYLQEATPRSAILVGGSKIGKTSLLHHLVRTLAQACTPQKQFWPVFIDLRATAQPTRVVFFTLLAQKIYAALPPATRQHVGDFKGFTNAVTDIYEAFLNYLATIYQASARDYTEVKLVLLLDEIEAIAPADFGNIVSNLRNLINGSSQSSFVALVVTGFRDFHDRAIRNKVESPLGNAALWLPLGVLNEEDCQRLITQPPTQLAAQTVPPAIVSAVYAQSGGHPYVAQYLMAELWQVGVAHITVADVEKAAAQFLQETRVFDSWFDKFQPADLQAYRQLTQTPAPLTAAEVQAQCAIIEGANMGDSLRFLCYAGVVVESGNKYQVAGQLFKNWALARLTSPTPAATGTAVVVATTTSPGKETPKSKGFDYIRASFVTAIALVVLVVVFGGLVFVAQQVPGLTQIPLILIGLGIYLAVMLFLLYLMGILTQKNLMLGWQQLLALINKQQLTPEAKSKKGSREAP